MKQIFNMRETIITVRNGSNGYLSKERTSKKRFILLKLYLFIFCILLCFNTVKGQVYVNRTPPFPKITTPDVASFNKFIDNPVDKYHGRPDVTIPLYTINDGDIELPISLRYNTSGIKVREEASWVGLGWNLNVGGVITQNCIQYDEYDTHYEEFMSDGFFDSNQGMDIEGAWEGGYFDLIYYLDVYNKLYCAVAGHDYCTRQLGKIHPDVFYFSYPGNSGKFIIDYLNGDKPCVLSKEENIDIQVIYEENAYPRIRGFKVITSKGIVHTFDSPLEMKTGNEGEYSDVSTVSYRLSSTFYPNGQSIQYYYTTVNISTPDYIETNTAPSTRVDGFLGSDYKKNTSNYYGEEAYLDSIITSSYKVLLETSSRDDLENGKKLTKVTIDEINSQAILPEIEFDFIYSNFISDELTDDDYYWNRGINGWPYGSNYASKRLKLDTIVSKNNGLAKHRYGFTYNETKLPRKDSYAVDYWGYYNGKISNKSMIPDFNKLYYAYVNGMTENREEETAYINSIINSYGIRPGSDRSYDFNYAQAAMLKGIEYPTGGYTEFEYEPNTFGEIGVKRKDGYVPDYYIPNSQEITENTNTFQSRIGTWGEMIPG